MPYQSICLHYLTSRLSRSIAITWDNDEHTIVRYCFDKRWTWNEFSNAKEQAVSLIASVPYKVGVIMDAPSDIELPPNMLTHSRNALGKKHPNTAVIVFVSTNPFMRLVVNTLSIISGASGSTIQIANNLDEAHSMIAAKLATV
jgi:hypothetical protein